jgi:hypothetical protein
MHTVFCFLLSIEDGQSTEGFLSSSGAASSRIFRSTTQAFIVDRRLLEGDG